MSNSWDDMRKAKEESYFEKREREKLNALKSKRDQDKPRLSPITGQPMEQVDYHGVTIDRCATSGGIWLDQGELEQLVTILSKQDADEEKSTGLNRFVSFFSGSK